MSATARNATARPAGTGASLSVASVMMPRVPSLPMKSCLRSSPVLFFSSAPPSSSTSPVMVTTSRPRTQARVEP